MGCELGPRQRLANGHSPIAVGDGQAAAVGMMGPATLQPVSGDIGVGWFVDADAHQGISYWYLT